MSMIIDIGAIRDEDMLRRMWQETDDFCRKKEIRAHMYKLRETRLRDFYSGDMDAGIGLSKTPLTASHGDSLADQSFQSFKTKEIRDSESPTREFKYGVPANLGGWNIMTSSELSNDGKKHTTHSLATTDGVHDLADGKAKFTGRNEKISSVAFDGNDKNYTTSSGENTNMVLEENIVQGDENNRKIENKKSTVTTSSKVIRSHYESGDTDYELQQNKPSEPIDTNIIYNEAPQIRTSMQQQHNNNAPRNNSPPSNNNAEQLLSRTVEYPDPHTKVIREVKSFPDGSTMTTTKYETRSGNSEAWTSSNTSKNTSSSTSRVVNDDCVEHNRIRYIIDDQGNQVPYQPNRHIQNKTTKDVEGYEIIMNATNDRNIPQTVKKDLARAMERLTDSDDVVRTITTATTTTKTNRNDEVYDVKRPSKVDQKPNETEYTRKRISVDLDPTHEAFARSLRGVSPVSDRDSIRSHRSTTSSIRSSISPDKGFRTCRSNSRDTDISQISSQTVTKSPTPGLKTTQRASPTKRPDIVTTTVKTEKIVRTPEKENYGIQQPKQLPKVTDLDMDGPIVSKTTMVTSTTTDRKDRPKSNRPPYGRSETYEERCRKILGMPEPDEQPKSPVVRRSKFTTTAAEFIEKEKLDIVKNRANVTEPNLRPSTRPTSDETTTVNTSTFDRKIPLRPQNLPPNRDETIETTEVRTTQRRPNETVPNSKRPTRVSPDRKSPSKLTETTITTITRKTRDPDYNSHSPDRKTEIRSTINREPLDHNLSKIDETTNTTIARETPRGPRNEHVSPDRKPVSSHRPTTDHGLPDRKIVTVNNCKNVGKYKVEIDETTIDRKPSRRSVNEVPGCQSSNPKTTVIETVTSTTLLPIKKLDAPKSDDEFIDESVREGEPIERNQARKPNYKTSPQDDTSENLTETDDEINATIITETIWNHKQPRPKLDKNHVRYITERIPSEGPSKIIEKTTPNQPAADENESDYEPSDYSLVAPETDEEIVETIVTRKTHRFANDDLLKTPNSRKTFNQSKIPYHQPSSHSMKSTTNMIETDEENIESTALRNTLRRPNDDQSPDRQSPNRTIIETTITQPTPRRPNDVTIDRKSPDRNIDDLISLNRRSSSHLSSVTDEITEVSTLQTTPRHPSDVTANRKTPERQSLDRPANRSTKVIETNNKITDASITRTTKRRPIEESPERQLPDHKLKTTSELTKIDNKTTESIVTCKTQKQPIYDSPDHQPVNHKTTDRSSPDRKSPSRPSKFTEKIKETTITRTTPRHPDALLPINHKSPDRQSLDRKTIDRTTVDRRSPSRSSNVPKEITETITTRKTPRHPNDVPANPKTPDRQSPDRHINRSTNEIETNDETIESLVTRTTQQRPIEDSPDRQSPDRRYKTDAVVIETDDEITKSIVARKTQRRPNYESSDRQSPNRKIIDQSSPDRKSPSRPSKFTEEITETTIRSTTPRHPNDVSIDRKSPDRHSHDHRITERTTPDRQSPSRSSTVTEEIKEATTTRKMPRNKFEVPTNRTIPDRQSPNRHINRATKITETNNDKTIETSVTRQTQSRAKEESPERQSQDRNSKEAPDATETDDDTNESTVIQQTQKRTSYETPDRESVPEVIRIEKGESPDRTLTKRRSPDQSNIIQITETIVTHKIPNRETPERIIPNRQSPERTVANTRSPDRNAKSQRNESTVTRKTPDRQSPERKVHDRNSKVTEEITETTIVQKIPNRQSPNRLTKDTSITGTNKEIVETTVTRKTQHRPNGGNTISIGPDKKSPDRKTPAQSMSRSPERPLNRNVNENIMCNEREQNRQPNDKSPDRRSPHHGDTIKSITKQKSSTSSDRNLQSPDRLTKRTNNQEIFETELTNRIQRRSNDNCRSPDPKSITKEKETKFSPITSRQSPDRAYKTDEETVETTVTRKTIRRHNDGLPNRRSPDRITLTKKTKSSTEMSTSPVRTSKTTKNKKDEEFNERIVTRKVQRHPIDGSPDRKSYSTKITELKLSGTSPERIQRRTTESPTRKSTTSVTTRITGRRATPTYTDTSPLRQKPVQKSPEDILESDELTDEPINRDRGNIEPRYLRPTQSSKPKIQLINRKTSTAVYINETNEETPGAIVKRKPDYENSDHIRGEQVDRRSVSKIPDTRSRDDRSVEQSPKRFTSEESEIDDETVVVNQSDRFIKSEIHDMEPNHRHPSSERPGPFREKPDDVEVIFERAVDTTNLIERDNSLVEEEREVGCKLTGKFNVPKRRSLASSPTRHHPFESSPSQRTTLKKSSKFDDDNEEITTTVERRTIRRPTQTDISPDRQTPRTTKPRSHETSPVGRQIIKTVKEIIISPTKPRKPEKESRSPETSPTRHATHITTITKTIPDRSISTTLSKSRPQTTSSQQIQRKLNLDRINSEIITDRNEKRSITTSIKSKQKTAPEIVSPAIQRYTTKTESPVLRPNKKKSYESHPGLNEVIEEVIIRKDAKKLCDGDVCGPRPSINSTTPSTKRIISKQDATVRPVTKITEKIDHFSSNATTTTANKRLATTERKHTAPITPSNRVPPTDKFGRSASENQIRTSHTPKLDVNEPMNKERRPSLKSKASRPTKCIATKTINITNTNLTVENDEMDIVIDIQQAKSSREPSPNKMIPVPVSPETDTGPTRYPDNVTEPEDERKPRQKITNIPIFEEDTSTFVSCDISEVPTDHLPHYDDLEEGNVDESDDDVDHNRVVKVTDNDECLLSVSDKVSRFINLADETSKVTKKITEGDREIVDRRRPVEKDLENDDCLLSVSDKVSKFIMTAEEIKKPKASTDFITNEKICETENQYRPENDHEETTEDEEIDNEEEEIHINKINRDNARKVTKIIKQNPSETIITTTTTTTTRKVKPVEARMIDEEISVTRPKDTKVSTIASKFTKPNDQVSSSIKRITTDTKVSSIRTKFDKNVEPDDEVHEFEDRYEQETRDREPFFLNQNTPNDQQVETISKIVKTSITDEVQDDQQILSKSSVIDRFKPNKEGSKIKKITSTPILQSTEVMKKAKEIFEHKPNDRPKQIDILSRPSVWKYKTNDVKLTDIGVKTNKTDTTAKEIGNSEEEYLIEVPKTPKLSQRDELTLKNLRDVTNISSKKDLFERKFSSERITNREFSESPNGGSSATTPTDSQGHHTSSNKPSYMNHTVSSLEHINRRDSRSQIVSDHESIDENNSTNLAKFGVELRRVDSQNATKTRRKSSSTEIPCIEEIWDLELLERMLETVVGYEHRRRIRSQIRIIKKQIEDEEIHTPSHHTSSEITTKRISKERTRSPTSKRIETVTKTTTVPKSQPTQRLSPMRTATKTSRVHDDPDQNVSKIVTTTTTITKGGDEVYDDKPIWLKKNLLKKPSENQFKPTPTTTTSTSSTTRKYNTSSYREVEKTDSVTSSYGIGPTDENGKPLFGIRALKKQAQKTEKPIEPVYSTDSDTTYQMDDQIRKIAESIDLRAPHKIREGYQSATKTIKKSTKNFIQHEIDDQPDSDGEEIEQYEYESNDRTRSKLTKKVHTNVQSFLGSEKIYSGFNDVIDRMKNADHVKIEGDTESDREARALLNKFLGASILVQATENVLPEGLKVSQKTTRTLKSELPASSTTREVTTTKLTKVKSSSSNNTKDNTFSNNNTGAVATTITTTAINDIDCIWDDSYLRKLLEQSSSYEERRKIRARIRQIMTDKEGGKTTTEIVKETKKDDDGAVTTTTTKVIRTVTPSKPVSPFAKFRQLDKQASAQSPPNSPHTPNTPKTPGQTSAPIFKFTDPALNRRVATFKEQLLQWCQIKTREYENVKIENFSTSWSDGLAFCALIHHFRPDAFDYTKLVATQRRYNFDLAFRVADEKAGIAPLLDVEDMVVMRKPDWKCVFTYVQSIYRRFKDAD